MKQYRHRSASHTACRSAAASMTAVTAVAGSGRAAAVRRDRNPAAARAVPSCGRPGP
jgi:hypothetical protein